MVVFTYKTVFIEVVSCSFIIFNHRTLKAGPSNYCLTKTDPWQKEIGEHVKGGTLGVMTRKENQKYRKYSVFFLTWRYQLCLVLVLSLRLRPK